MGLEKGYGALEWMSSEKINKLLDVIPGEENGKIGGKGYLDGIS
jgi:hypothetical protein